MHHGFSVRALFHLCSALQCDWNRDWLQNEILCGTLPNTADTNIFTPIYKSVRKDGSKSTSDFQCKLVLKPNCLVFVFISAFFITEWWGVARCVKMQNVIFCRATICKDVNSTRKYEVKWSKRLVTWKSTGGTNTKNGKGTKWKEDYETLYDWATKIAAINIKTKKKSPSDEPTTIELRRADN